MFYAVIIGGGRGERFWPKSRRSSPKQFLRLFGKKSLIELTVQRIQGLCPPARQRFVIPYDLISPLKRTMPAIKKNNIIIEPEGKNTAIAIGLAAIYIIRQDPKAVLAVLPADHLIKNTSRFHRCLKFAKNLAQEGYLVTFGVPPTRPETGYGYIKVGQKLKSRDGLVAYHSQRFTEKPSPRQAIAYLNQGNYLWNSGMFVWTAEAILEAINRFMPKLGKGLAGFKNQLKTRQETPALKRLYRSAQPISIDHGVLERAENIAVVRADFDWDDVGSWVALERHCEKNLDNNAVFGKFLGIDTKDSIIWAEDGMVATVGVSDMVVVKTRDVVLVCPKERAQDVKKLVERLVKDEVKELL